MKRPQRGSWDVQRAFAVKRRNIATVNKPGAYQRRMQVATILRTPPAIRYGQYTQSRGGEVKSVDILGPAGGAQAAFTLNATEQLTALPLITIGSSSWNRIGRKVALKSLHIRAFLQQTGNAVVPGLNWYRILVVYDKQTNGALPTISDILKDQRNGATDQPVTAVTSGINLNNRERFEILMDECGYTPAYDTAAPAAASNTITGIPDAKLASRFIKLKGRECHFQLDSSPAVIGDISTGNLILCTFGNIAAGSEPFGLTASIRLRYSDL